MREKHSIQKEIMHNPLGMNIVQGMATIIIVDLRDYGDRMSKVKIEAPTFDGSLDPWVFSGWLCQMEQFF